MNNFLLVGEYLENPAPNIIILERQRNYKNDNGEYDSDILPVKIFETSSNIFDYIKIGDVIGVRGRIESIEPTHTPQLIAEKLTFLNKNNDKEPETFFNYIGEGEI